MKETLSKIDAALIIVFLTVWAYAVAFSYRSGWTAYYKIPKDFIDMNISLMVRPIGLVAGIFIIVSLYTFFFQRKRLNFLNKITNKINPYVLLAIFLLISIIIAFNGALHITSKQDEYLVIEGKEPLVVLDLYKEKAIVAPVNLEKGIITPEFQLLKLESTPKEPIKMKLTKTGTLKVKEPDGYKSTK